MKIPKKIWIYDSEWTIKTVRKIKEHGNTKHSVTLGLCDPSDKTIYLKTGLSFELKMDTLLHELMHAIEFERDLEVSHAAIYTLAEGLAKIYIDNFI